jgi:hypothetical protein
MVAAGREDVAFVVLLAGTGMPGREILLAQSALIGSRMGASEEQVAQARALNEKIYDAVAAGGDSAATAARVRELLVGAARSQGTAPADSVQLEAMVRVQVRQVMSPWFRSFLTHDPRPVLARVRCRCSPSAASWTFRCRRRRTSRGSRRRSPAAATATSP